MQSEEYRKGAKLFHYLVVIALIGGVVLFISTTVYSGSNDDPVGERENEVYSVQGVPMPEQVTFAGEPMPLDLFDVKEALDRELLSNAYFHSQTIRLIKLANRYFPQIEPVLKKNLVPDDFKYLAVAESGLSQAVSPAKAVGFWQLLKGTAGDFRVAFCGVLLYIQELAIKLVSFNNLYS